MGKALSHGSCPGMRYTVWARSTTCCAKAPQSAMKATASPTCRCSTALPHSSTRPTPSVPGTKGSGGLRWYFPSINSPVAWLTLA